MSINIDGTNIRYLASFLAKKGNTPESKEEFEKFIEEEKIAEGEEELFWEKGES